MDLTAVLDAAALVALNETSKLRLDKTIQALIVSLDDATVGEYTVSYEGNSFKAYAANPSITYKEKKKVYVKVPEGDFKQKKFIEGEASTRDQSLLDSMGITQSIELIEPTWDTIYHNQSELFTAWGLCSGDPSDAEALIWSNPGNAAYNAAFQSYAKTFKQFQISADFHTALLSSHSKGEYGVEVVFENENHEEISYKLTFNSFIGAPYSFNNWATQTANFNLPGNILLLSKVKFFQAEMEYDINSQGEVQYNKNIFCKNIKLGFILVIDYTQTQYYLAIVTPDGTSFINPGEKIRLEGKLIYKGKNIMSDSTCVCDWYEEDLSVMVGSAEYDTLAAARWKKISSRQTLTVNYDEVRYKQKYRLICTYNEQIVTSAEVTLTRYQPDYDIILELDGTEDTLILRVRDALGSTVAANWYRELIDGSYVEMTEFRGSNTLEIANYELHNNIVFYALVYDVSTTAHISNESITIFSPTSADNMDVVFHETLGVYSYDANGDITLEEAQKERTLYATVRWAPGYGGTYKTIWKLNGTVINDEANKYSPSDSMLYGLWCDNLGVIHYKVRQKFDINRAQNTFTLVIETLDGSQYEFLKTQLFFKDGDQGTNGTSFNCIVSPCEYKDSTLILSSGFKALTYGSAVPMILKASIYKDGVEVVDGADYKIRYEWTIPQVEVNGEDVDVFTIYDGYALPDNYIAIRTNTNIPLFDGLPSTCNYYVKVKIDITDRRDLPPAYAESDLAQPLQSLANALKALSISYIYPVSVFITEGDERFVSIQAPQFIKYTSSGISAKFKNLELVYAYDGLDKTELVEVYGASVAAPREGKLISIRNNKIVALSKYMGSGTDITSALICPTLGGGKLLYPIILYMDTYGNENINGWDGTSIKIEQDSEGHDGSYLLAPQIGAGYKDREQLFYGVIMGLESSTNKTGLYGYKAGINTFGLLEDGTAYFGSKNGGGQIVIDGTSATIYGNPNGDQPKLTIQLTDVDSSSAGTTRAIGMSNNKFYVTYDGKLHAEEADIAGKITASEGQIGGFTIGTDNRLTGGDIYCRYLYANNGGNIGGFDISNGLLSNGTIYCDYLYANKYGYIGGWDISNGMLSSGDTWLMGSSGKIAAKTYYVQDSASSASIGWIGELTGVSANSSGESTKTYDNVGIKATAKSLILESLSDNVRVQAGDNIYLKAGDNIYVKDDTSAGLQKLYNYIAHVVRSELGYSGSITLEDCVIDLISKNAPSSGGGDGD